MLNALRRQLNPATMMAFIALVFATTGGAYAVTSHAGSSAAPAVAAKKKSKSTGKPGPRGPVGPKGETGPAGSAGPAGPAGAKGEAGAAGAKGETGTAGNAGANGVNGESVSITKLEPEEGGCVEGGARFTAGGKEATACNGEKGEAAAGGGFPKTLPSGATETGSFAAKFEKTGSLYTSVSFPIPLPVPLSVPYTYVNLEEQEQHTAPAACSGSATQPTAGKGRFCIYEGGAERPAGTHVLSPVSFLSPTGAGAEISTVGGTLVLEYEGPEELALLFGSWAVTAS